MQTVVIVIHLMVVLALVGVVLLQRSEGGGLGIGGGSGFMTARGAANALTRTTAVLAAAFFATSLILSLLARYGEKPTDVLDKVPAAQTQQGEGGVLKQLGGKDIPTPVTDAPATPAPDATKTLAPAAPAADSPAATPPAATAPAAALPVTPEAPASSTEGTPATPVPAK